MKPSAVKRPHASGLSKKGIQGSLQVRLLVENRFRARALVGPKVGDLLIMSCDIISIAKNSATPFAHSEGGYTTKLEANSAA